MKELYKKITLAPYVAVGYKQGILNLGFGSLNVQISEKPLQRIVLELAAFFKKPREIDEIYKLAFSKELIDQGMQILRSKNFLIEENSWCEMPEGYQRMALALLSEGVNPISAYKNISNKRILVLGCGAIGTSMALMLATLGVKHFILVDEDTYDITNTGRSPHITQSMVGENKAEALKKLLKNKSSEIEVDTYLSNVNSDINTTLPDCDFIILSADSSYLLSVVNEISIRQRTSFMQVGYAHDQAVRGPLVVPGITGCIACRGHILKPTELSYEEKDLMLEINTGYLAPAPPYLVQFTVSLAAKDLINFFVKGQALAFNRQLAVSIDNLIIREMAYEKFEECSCQTKSLKVDKVC
jgi:hypothetical protein